MVPSITQEHKLKCRQGCVYSGGRVGHLDRHRCPTPIDEHEGPGGPASGVVEGELQGGVTLEPPALVDDRGEQERQRQLRCFTNDDRQQAQKRARDLAAEDVDAIGRDEEDEVVVPLVP